MKNFNSIIISRTDNLGDVVLTLPLCGILKATYPGIKIFFIGKSYTKPLIDSCLHVDTFLDREEIIADKNILKSINADAIVHVFPDFEIARAARSAKIKLRIGTSHRFFHWLTCNKLLGFSRIKSDLHEAQLNIKLLAPFGIERNYSLSEIGNYYGMKVNTIASDAAVSPKTKIILHPKSKGSAREWKLENYFQLALQLDASKYEVFVTGTQSEGERIKHEMPHFFEKSIAVDFTGVFSLEELILFINEADILVACSTGPLHIAAALGKHAIGFYPPLKPMHSGRWAPIGKHVKVFEKAETCPKCADPNSCECINSFSASQVREYIEEIKNLK